MKRSWPQRGAAWAWLLAVSLHAVAWADDAADGGTTSDAGISAMTIESFESSPMAVDTFEATPTPTDTPSSMAVDEFEAVETAPIARVYGAVRGETSLDTRFDSPRNVALAENVAEGRIRAHVGVDVKVNERIRLVLEGRAYLRLVTQREFDRAKGFFEPQLGDAFVDVYTSRADVRVGNQRIPLGANPALAPADALNPRDLRDGFLGGELEDALLPVFAVRGQGEIGSLTWLAAYVPFFQPHRYFVFGQDEALVQPTLAGAFDNRRVDPSIEDVIQDRVLETQRPVPFAGDVAVRLTRRGRVTVGASWVWMNEKFPRVTVDPEVTALSKAQAAGRVDSAAAISVLNRFQAGETLYRGSYARTHLLSLEGSTLIGPGQLDVDVSFSPRQTFVDASFSPVDKASVTAVVGYSQASESPVVYSVSYLGLVVPGVGANEQLYLLEPATAVGGARAAIFHLFVGNVGVPVWKGRFELSLRAAVEPIHPSIALSPRVTFQGYEALKIWLAAEVYEGNAWSPFGAFSRNDKVMLGVRYEVL